MLKIIPIIRIVRGTAGIIILAGAAALAGRLLNVPFLARLVPEASPVLPFTAVAFLLCGACLWLETAAPPRPGWTRALAGALLTGSTAILLAHVFGLLAAPETSSPAGTLFPDARSPGRTGILTAALFFCAGMSLLLFDVAKPRIRALMHLPVLPLFWFVYLSLTAGFYGVKSHAPPFAYTLLPLNATILFMLLGTGILMARPRDSISAAITSRFNGGKLARILLPIILLLPFTIGWIRVRALLSSEYDMAAAFAQFATTNVLIFGMLTWFCATILNRMDARRQNSYESLRKSNIELRRVNDALEAKIAEQKNTEEARKKTELQLFQSQKMQAVGTLASGIAHDFNNILTVILLNAEAAEDALPQDHPLRQSLREIRSSGARGSRLIRQIMTFGRNDSGERKPVNLDTVIAEAIEMLRHTLPSSVHILTDLRAGTARVSADAVQIHQMLLNLGTNAAHAMAGNGGNLEIRTRLLAAPGNAPQVLEEREGGHVRITIRDNGHGMGAETLKRIFDPFFTTKPRDKGTGLGLSVVHGILKLHGGDITVSSTPGQGTIFTLDLPALAAPSRIAPSESPRPAFPPGKGARLLCVDDNELVLSSIRRRLERLDYVVTCKSNPREALETFRARPGDFDLALTDFSMPGMSGPDFCRELLRIRPGIPVIVMSGFLSPEDIKAAEKDGVRAFVRKPDVMEELGKILRRLQAEKENQESGLGNGEQGGNTEYP